ncbi:MAG: tetratricopeptide repeat protein [Candidatus Hodarchaeota archaeon]
MISKSCRIEPFEAEDGEYVNLVHFAILAGKVLWSGFKPTPEWSERVTERTPGEWSKTQFIYGNLEMNVEVTHKTGYNPSTCNQIADDLCIICHGLADGINLEMHATRLSGNQRSLELRVAGSEEAVSKVIEYFNLCFQSSIVPESEMQRLHKSASNAFNIHAWRVVERYALRMLELEPHDPTALMFLGVARAEQGYEPEGEHLLLSALTFNSRHLDSYYNLGRLVLKQGRYILASNLFKRGLDINSKHHSMNFHLGQALERLGLYDEAAYYYESTIESSPNEIGNSDFLIEDYTKEASDSLTRLRNL